MFKMAIPMACLSWALPGLAATDNPLQVTGTWQTEGVDILFDQQGDQVSGRYTVGNGELIVGPLKVDTLETYWTEDPRTDGSGVRCSKPLKGRYHWGRIRFVFEGDRFSANWDYCEGVRPGGTLTGIRRPPAPDKALAERELELAQCQTKGGELREMVAPARPVCVIPYPDAGKVCTDSSQCTGTCRITSDESRAKQVVPGAAAVKGTCQRDKFDIAGCYAKVSKGMMGVIICMD